MPRLLSAIVLVLGMMPAIAVASDRPVVVELFTSQGCSSCPPADRLLKELAGRDDVIPLALHVDYWDYLGWKDVFAQHKFTKRQKYYARAMEEQVIYTPQMVINGRTHIVGSDRASLEALISEEVERASRLELSAERQEGAVMIRARQVSGSAQQIDVHLVHVTPVQDVSIARGENAGQTFTYSNIVREWNNIGQWNGRGALTLEAPLTSDLPAVVLLQSAQNGPILSAIRVE